MQTSMKLKSCSRFLIASVKSTLNLECFERNDQSQRLSAAELINCETGTYLNVQKTLFQARLRQATC